MNDIIKPCSSYRNLSGYFIPSPINVETKPLNDELGINLLRVFELDLNEEKRYIRSFAILINNILFTINVRETETFINELLLFEKGDKNNKYFTIASKDSIISLKLKSEKINIYITKSQSKSIVEYFFKLNRNYNMSYAYEEEIELTLEGYNYHLVEEGKVIRKYSDEDVMKRFKMFCK